MGEMAKKGFGVVGGLEIEFSKLYPAVSFPPKLKARMIESKE